MSPTKRAVKRAVKKRVPPKRVDPMFSVKKEFWLVTLIRLCFIITIAYFSAAFIDLCIIRITELPHGPLWDAQFKAPLFFVLMVVICVLISIPYFMKEWDPTLRSYSMYTVVLIVAYAVFDGSGFIDPGFPLKWLIAHAVTPLKPYFQYRYR